MFIRTINTTTNQGDNIMTDSCLVCQCEPIEDNGWFIRKDGECVCPWCVNDMIAKQDSGSVMT